MTKAFIEKVVDVEVALGTQPLSTTYFDLPLILTCHNVFATRTQRFTSLKAMTSAGFDSNSPAYKQASLMFSGINKPDSVLIGRRAMTTAVVSFVAANNTTYTLTLREGSTFKTFSYTSDATATALEIATGLQTLIAADIVWKLVVTATVSGNTVVLTPIVGKYFDVGVGANSSVVYNHTEDLTDTLTAVTAENDNWFFITTDSHVLADVQDVAAWAEANDKIYAWSSQATAIRDKTAGNDLLVMQALGYDKTIFTQWAADADTTFPEAGLVGAMVGQPLDSMGTTTAHGKTLKGVSPNTLTTTQLDNVVSSGGNVYVTERGVGFYRDGYMLSGNFLDTIIFSIWLKVRIGESLTSLIKRQSDLRGGIRYDTEGLLKVKQAIDTSPIQIGIRNGTISNETPTSADGTVLDWRPTITIPDIGTISEDNLANRVLDDVQVSVVYTGFVHYIQVNANVLLRRD